MMANRVARLVGSYALTHHPGRGWPYGSAFWCRVIVEAGLDSERIGRPWQRSCDRSWITTMIKSVRVPQRGSDSRRFSGFGVGGMRLDHRCAPLQVEYQVDTSAKSKFDKQRQSFEMGYTQAPTELPTAFYLVSAGRSKSHYITFSRVSTLDSVALPPAKGVLM